MSDAGEIQLESCISQVKPCKRIDLFLKARRIDLQRDIWSRLYDEFAKIIIITGWCEPVLVLAQAQFCNFALQKDPRWHRIHSNVGNKTTVLPTVEAPRYPMQKTLLGIMNISTTQ